MVGSIAPPRQLLARPQECTKAWRHQSDGLKPSTLKNNFCFLFIRIDFSGDWLQHCSLIPSHCTVFCATCFFLLCQVAVKRWLSMHWILQSEGGGGVSYHRLTLVSSSELPGMLGWGFTGGLWALQETMSWLIRRICLGRGRGVLTLHQSRFLSCYRPFSLTSLTEPLKTHFFPCILAA